MLNRDGTSFYGNAAEIINEDNMRKSFQVNVHIDKFERNNDTYRSVIPLSLA